MEIVINILIYGSLTLLKNIVRLFRAAMLYSSVLEMELERAWKLVNVAYTHFVENDQTKME